MTDDDTQPATAFEPGGAQRVDARLLEILVCPLTKTALEYDKDRNELISRAAKLAFPIRDGVPIMLTEEARALDEDAGTR